MKTLASACFLLAAAIAGSACSKAAEAQAEPAPEADPVGPIRCYTVAEGRLASLTARQLCAGAQSDAPARCFAQVEAANQLSQSQALALCYGATSTEPAACAAQAAADGKLANQTIVQSCAAGGGAVKTSADVPACIAEGRSALRLSDFELTELCAPGSTSYGNF